MKKFILLLALGMLATATAQTSRVTASQALLESSDSSDARRIAAHSNHDEFNDAFIEMEAAALQGDDDAVLNSAIYLMNHGDQADPRTEIAGARVRSMAGNTSYFRKHLSRLKKLFASNYDARLAYIDAAGDGSLDLDMLQSSREAGLLTNWSLAGPFGKHSLLDFDQHFAPERDALDKKAYGTRRVHTVISPTGRFAMPDYLRSQGVYYASSDIYTPNDGDWNLFLESDGVAEVWIDGKPVLRRDDRIEAKPRLMRNTVHLSHGDHKVMIKFAFGAAPFRVAVLPPTGGLKRKQNIPVLKTTPESEYIQASLQFWRGNYSEALRLSKLLVTRWPSAAAYLLMIQSWQKLSPDAPEIADGLSTAAKLDPSNAFVLAMRADSLLQADQTEEGLALLKKAASLRPDNETVLKIEADEFNHLGWVPEARNAFNTLTNVHPSCENLQRAAAFASSHGEFELSRALESKLERCSPTSLSYAKSLAMRGEHPRAAKAAAKIANAFQSIPALEFEAREYLLAKDFAAARATVNRLLELAPGIDQFLQLSDAADKRQSFVIHTTELPVRSFAEYRRDGVATAQQYAAKRFSGGPAVLVLNDSAVLQQNSHRWIYTHRITRVLNRDGVITYGEIAVPRGAHILRLRTIKPDGETIEPEMQQNKTTLSMPALAPGDHIEEEYLTEGDPSDPLTFVFGSFDAPIISSRFTLIGSGVNISAQNTPKPFDRKASDGMQVRSWEKKDIAQSVREPAMPTGTVLPMLTLTPQGASIVGLREQIAEAMMLASRPGPRVTSLASELRVQDSRATAQRIYRAVMSQITPEPLSPDTEVTSAEESLVNGDGSRVATLIALSRAVGIPASLMLARNRSGNTSLFDYTHPIVVLRIAPNAALAADMEDNGLPLGNLSPLFDTIAIPIAEFTPTGVQLAKEDRRPLPPSIVLENSEANADVSLSSEGTLDATVTIRMGPWRAAQMRDVLRNASGANREKFFQQLASRLFSGALESDGFAENEDDPDKPLILHVTLNAPNYVEAGLSSVDIDQLTPALGLNAMFGRLPSRQFPLAIDSVLCERARFVLRLPEGVTLRAPASRLLNNEFGHYATKIRQLDNGTWEMQREFDIKMQVIPTERYPQFAAFANEVEKIERQRLTLISKTPASNHSASN